MVANNVGLVNTLVIGGPGGTPMNGTLNVQVSLEKGYGNTLVSSTGYISGSAAYSTTQSIFFGGTASFVGSSSLDNAWVQIHVIADESAGLATMHKETTQRVYLSEFANSPSKTITINAFDLNNYSYSGSSTVSVSLTASEM